VKLRPHRPHASGPPAENGSKQTGQQSAGLLGGDDDDDDDDDDEDGDEDGDGERLNSAADGSRTRAARRRRFAVGCVGRGSHVEEPGAVFLARAGASSPIVFVGCVYKWTFMVYGREWTLERRVKREREN